MADKQRAVRRQLFPEKLWELVKRADSGIQWSPDGKRIEVDRKQLEKFIGTFFRSHNFDSFIRQLHFYGFRKCGNSYHHEKFQRDQPDALAGMRRKYSNYSYGSQSSGSGANNRHTATVPDDLAAPPSPTESNNNHCYDSPSGSDSLSVINGNDQGLAPVPSAVFGTMANYMHPPAAMYTPQSLSTTSTPASTPLSMKINKNELKLRANSLAQQLGSPDAACTYDASDYAIDYSKKPRKASPTKLQPPSVAPLHTAMGPTTSTINNPVSVHFADEFGDKVAHSSRMDSDQFGAGKGHVEDIIVYTLETTMKSNHPSQPAHGQTNDEFPSFSTIKATPTKAVFNGNSLSINLTEAMKDKTSSAWPKTLVLNRFPVGDQGLMAAHFLYKVQNGMKPN